MRISIPNYVAVAALAALLQAGAIAQQAQSPAPAAKPIKRGANPQAPAVAAYQPGLEPKAIEILKATSARLAAAQSMAFTAVVSYEGPSLLGPPLIYSTKSEVTLQRPNKLKVITLGDGPPSEFYYDGKLMMAYAPTENLVAIADAPPTIDAALNAAYDSAAIYFPFMDVIVADPYKDFADGMTTAFFIGSSQVVGGTTTDMVAFVTKVCVRSDLDRRRGQTAAPHLRGLSERSCPIAARSGTLQLEAGCSCLGRCFPTPQRRAARRVSRSSGPMRIRG